MVIRLNSPGAKIALASLPVLLGSVIGFVLYLTLDPAKGNVENKVSVQAEVASYEPSPPTPQELDEIHSSWQFSSSREAVGLVDADNGFQTVTIGQ